MSLKPAIRTKIEFDDARTEHQVEQGCKEKKRCKISLKSTCKAGKKILEQLSRMTEDGRVCIIFDTSANSDKQINMKIVVTRK